MQRNRTLILVIAITFAVALALSGCANVEEGKTPLASNPSAAGSDSGKIPVTTTSEEARREFLQGRELQEKLLIQDSIAHFDKAVSLDPNFAIAELNRSAVSPTGKEFFDHLKKAVALSDKASNGERLLILATEAGANANAPKQNWIVKPLRRQRSGEIESEPQNRERTGIPTRAAAWGAGGDRQNNYSSVTIFCCLEDAADASSRTGSAQGARALEQRDG